MPSVTSLPDLILYARPACSLCEDAREAIRLLLADRRARGLAVPEVVERNIEKDPALHRLYMERIPVVELGEQRVELIVTIGKLRRIFAALDQASHHAAPATIDQAAPTTLDTDRATVEA